ncbi:MAG: hypothetical protein ONB24_01845 [candidate division KSB1 bacterium]|nr:hypothetical protein [candidate division KSB1 bacterium]
MNTLKNLFFDTTGLLFISVFFALLILFLLDFKVTSRQSWTALLAFAVLAGLVAVQSWRRKQLLRMLEEREKALQELEKRYEQLKEEAKISEAAYLAAKEELRAAKLAAAKAILKADGELDAELAKIEEEYANMSLEESIARIKAALGGGQ